MYDNILRDGTVGGHGNHDLNGWLLLCKGLKTNLMIIGTHKATGHWFLFSSTDDIVKHDKSTNSCECERRAPLLTNHFEDETCSCRPYT